MAVTRDLELAAKLSPEAETLVSTARSLDAEGLAVWLAGTDSEVIMIAVCELLRRGEPVPREVLFGNPRAMEDPTIRGYLLGLYSP